MPAPSPIPRTLDTLPTTADAVIIGGGVIGASTAFQLTRRGLRNVVVIEQGLLGNGATGKSGALVRCHYANGHEAALTVASLDIFRNWAETVGAGDCGFTAPGFVRVVMPENEAKLRANVATLQSVGVRTEVVDRQQLAEIEPLMFTGDLTFAAFEPDSGYADPNATLFGFAAAATAGGATFALSTRATNLVRTDDAVTGVVTDRGTIMTPRVLIAAGSWADRLLTPLGLNLGLVPVRSQVTIFRWPSDYDASRPHRVVIDSMRRSWLRPEGTNCTLIGAESSVEPIDPDTLNQSVDPATIEIGRSALAHRFPVFAQATMRGGWSGTFMRSGDDHPIIDQIPSIPGLWVMTGDSGSSFKTSPAIGVCLAEWMTEDAPQLVDLHPFRASRFAEQQPWHDKFAYDTPSRETISR